MDICTQIAGTDLSCPHPNSDKQHIAISIGFGGLFPTPDVMKALLFPQERNVKRVLDLGV